MVHAMQIMGNFLDNHIEMIKLLACMVSELHNQTLCTPKEALSLPYYLKSTQFSTLKSSDGWVLNAQL